MTDKLTESATTEATPEQKIEAIKDARVKLQECIAEHEAGIRKVRRLLAMLDKVEAETLAEISK